MKIKCTVVVDVAHVEGDTVTESMAKDVAREGILRAVGQAQDEGALGNADYSVCVDSVSNVVRVDT